MLAVRGPTGSRIAVGAESNEVASWMTEEPEEGPVRRYLERGVAAVAVPLDLAYDAHIYLGWSIPLFTVVHVVCHCEPARCELATSAPHALGD